MTRIWAHARSERISASNTLEAFEAAIEEGADGLEFDVHQTADGVLVCAHDAVLRDAQGAPVRIGDHTFAQLQALDVGDETTGPARVPRLDEVHDLYAPTDRLLNIEVKNLPSPYPGIAQNVIDHVARSGMADRIVVSSFHHRLLREIQQIEPTVSVAALYSAGLLEPWRYLEGVGIREAHPQYPSLYEPGEIEGYAQAGIPVRAWTVDDPEAWRHFLDAGIDGIITNLPASARKVRDGA